MQERERERESLAAVGAKIIKNCEVNTSMLNYPLDRQFIYFRRNFT